MILLEQEHPLRYQGLQPAEMEYQTNSGRTAFLEDASHPVLQGLQDKDFFTWEPGEVVYKNAYVKPQRGARSLVQCNESLVSSALVTIPVNQGLVTLCQLLVSEKLADNPTAETLSVEPAGLQRHVRTEVPEDGGRRGTRVWPRCSTRSTCSTRPLPIRVAALAEGQIAVVSATPANLHQLASAPDKLQAFHAAGVGSCCTASRRTAWQDFNKLVGVEHMLRPFRRERVTFALPRSRLLAGVSLSDVALYSAERIFPWQSGNFVASDTFSHVVDLDEVAPFGTWDSEAWIQLRERHGQRRWLEVHPEPPRLDKHLSAHSSETSDAGRLDVGWKRAVQLDTQGRTGLRWRRSRIDSASTSRRTANRCEFDIQPPRTATEIAIRHAQYDDIPDKRQNGVQIIGCDNIEFFAQRPADYRERVRPMLNSGGLVEYPRGQGGIVLVEPALPGYRRSARERLEETQRAGRHLEEPRRSVRRWTGGDRGSTAGLHADRHFETCDRLPHATRLVR